MPINGNNILKAMRELKAPSTPEEIARHMAKGTKKKFEMLLQEVVVTLVGGVRFGYIECNNGHYYCIKNTTELFKLLEAEDLSPKNVQPANKVKNKSPLHNAVTNLPKQQKGRKAKKRKANVDNDCECETKLKIAKAKISKIIDEIAEKMECKRANGCDVQKLKPLAEELNMHVDQFWCVTESNEKVTEPDAALEVPIPDYETFCSELQVFKNSANERSEFYLTEENITNQNKLLCIADVHRGPVEELIVESEAHDIDNEISHSEFEVHNNFLIEKNGKQCRNDIFSNQDSNARIDILESITDSEVAPEVRDREKETFQSKTEDLNNLNNVVNNILTNQSLDKNLVEKSEEHSESRDHANDTELEALNNYENVTNIDQYRDFTDNMLTNQTFISTAVDIDSKSVEELQERFEARDYGNNTKLDAFNILENETNVNLTCNFTDNMLTNQTFITTTVDVDNKSAEELQKHSEARDPGNETKLEALNNFENETNIDQYRDFSDNMLTNQTFITTTVDVDNKSAEELQEHSEARDPGNETKLGALNNFDNETNINEYRNFTDNMLTNQSFITTRADVDNKSAEELQEHSETRDSSDITELAARNSFALGTNVKQNFYFTDDIDTIEAPLSTDTELIIDTEEQSEVCDHDTQTFHSDFESINEHADKINIDECRYFIEDIFTNSNTTAVADTKSVLNVQQEICERSTQTFNSELEVSYPFLSEMNVDLCDYIFPAPNFDVDATTEVEVSSEACDDSNETLHSEFNTFTNEINGDGFCYSVDDALSHQSDLSTIGDNDIESVEELEVQPKATDGDETLISEFNNIFNEINQDCHLIDDVTNESYFTDAEIQLMESVMNFDEASQVHDFGQETFQSDTEVVNNNVNKCCSCTDDVYHLPTTTNVEIESAAESEIQSDFDADCCNETVYPDYEVFNNFVNETNDVRDSYTSDDIFTHQNDSVGTADVSIESVGESRASEEFIESVCDNGTQTFHSDSQILSPFISGMNINLNRYLINDIYASGMYTLNLDTLRFEPMREAEQQSAVRDHNNGTLYMDFKDRNSPVTEINDDKGCNEINNFTELEVASETASDNRDLNSQPFQLEMNIPKTFLNNTDADCNCTPQSHSQIVDKELSITMEYRGPERDTLHLEFNIPQKYVRETQNAFVISVKDMPKAEDEDGSPLKKKRKL